MIRYWFQFDFREYEMSIPFGGVVFGCGVTDYDYNHALSLLKNKVFKNETLPKIIKVIENVDISKLDEGIVIPNMSPPIYIGVWFPLGYK